VSRAGTLFCDYAANYAAKMLCTKVRYNELRSSTCLVGRICRGRVCSDNKLSTTSDQQSPVEFAPVDSKTPFYSVWLFVAWWLVGYLLISCPLISPANLGNAVYFERETDRQTGIRTAASLNAPTLVAAKHNKSFPHCLILAQNKGRRTSA